jgi:L-serine deaminase
LFWLAFSEDGSEATWLKIEDVFGGHARGNSGKAALTAGATGLSPQQNELANHAEDLLNAGDKMRAATLWRDLERKNGTNPDAMKKLRVRFKSLK